MYYGGIECCICVKYRGICILYLSLIKTQKFNKHFGIFLKNRKVGINKGEPLTIQKKCRSFDLSRGGSIRESSSYRSASRVSLRIRRIK